MTTRALLIILAGVRPEHEDDFNLWYDREHLPDRVAVPGFLAARRHRAQGPALWPWLALYEVEDIAVFSGAAYRERLANQSDWSRRILPLFVDPQRSIARLKARIGDGAGAATRLLALRPRGPEDAFLAAFAETAAALRGRDPSLLSLSLYAADPDLSRPVAEYPPAAASPVRGDDWFVLAEATGPEGGAGLAEALAALPLSEPPLAIGAYLFRCAVSAHEIA